jgi:DNA-directed RNA polymerase subunit RPC12/RpoP
MNGRGSRKNRVDQEHRTPDLYSDLIRRMNVALSFKCVFCGNGITVKYLKSGEKAKCPHCGEYVVVPEEGAEIESLPELVRLTTEISKKTSSEEVQLKPVTSPWIGIWFHPREAIRLALVGSQQTEAYAIAAIYGIVHNLHLVQRHGVSPEVGIPLWGIIVVNLLGGAVFGAGMLILFSWMVSWFSKLLGGIGSVKSARIALGWSCLPYVTLLIIIPLMFIEPDTFVYHPKGQSPVSALATSYFLLRGIMTIWFLVISVVAVSEALKLSISKCLLILLASVILFTLITFLSILLFVTIFH